jgi:hypothetical protein
MFEELLRTRRIRREKVSAAEINRALERAERDLKTAKMVMAQDWDWGFAFYCFQPLERNEPREVISFNQARSS